MLRAAFQRLLSRINEAEECAKSKEEVEDIVEGGDAASKSDTSGSSHLRRRLCFFGGGGENAATR